MDRQTFIFYYIQFQLKEWEWDIKLGILPVFISRPIKELPQESRLVFHSPSSAQHKDATSNLLRLIVCFMSEPWFPPPHMYSRKTEDNVSLICSVTDAIWHQSIVHIGMNRIYMMIMLYKKKIHKIVKEPEKGRQQSSTLLLCNTLKRHSIPSLFLSNK